MTSDRSYEETRLKALEELYILDSEKEQIFDDITQLASSICQVPIALITLIAKDRQWFKSKVGIDIDSTSREIAFCNYAIEHSDPLIVNDALEDLRFSSNPLVTGEPNIRFYTGAPIITDSGFRLGTLCVIDQKPRQLSQEQLSNLAALSRQVMRLLESRRDQIEKAAQQKKIDEEKNLILLQETEARRLAEDASRMKDDFLATVSHELRTPLNAILGWAKVMSMGKLDSASTMRATDTIIRSAQSQAKLIDDLLDISRIISGKLRLEARETDFTTIIQSVVESLSLAAETKSIAMRLTADHHVRIVGDAERLQQVVWNLLSNAIKFTPRSGNINVILKKHDSHVTVDVKDTGQGIDQDFLPHVFDRFRQADGSTTRRSGGMGLGLSIVKHLVEMHGGTVAVKSNGSGHGSTFSLALPVRPLEDFVKNKSVKKAFPSFVTAEPVPAIPTLNGVTVAIIDDEKDSLLLVEQILCQWGAAVTICNDVAHCLEVIKTTRPRLLISDIGMPDEDGYNLIRKIRSLPVEDGGQTPAIALTAYARVEDRVKALTLGFQMFISKPLEPMELVAAVSSLTFFGQRNQGTPA